MSRKVWTVDCEDEKTQHRLPSEVLFAALQKHHDRHGQISTPADLLTGFHSEGDLSCPKAMRNYKGCLLRVDAAMLFAHVLCE